MAIDELTIIDRYLRPLAGAGSFNFMDDAGQLRAPDGFDLVVTTDMLATGVHFLPGDPPATIAQKAIRVNVSDLAAKGAKPLAYLLGLGLGDDTDEAWLAAFADGLREDQKTFGISLLGGDTISVPAGPVISVTAFGLAPAGGMVHRTGGTPGDALYVTGTIGAAAAGLALLRGEAGPWDALPAPTRESLVGRYRVPKPRVALAMTLVQYASAAMDISDGLVGDCDKLALASACSATIEAGRIPLPSGLGLLDDRLLARLITAGDDYEILAAVPPAREAGFQAGAREAGEQVARIGSLRAGKAPTEVVLEGRPLPLHRRAWTHVGGRSG